MNNTVKNCMSLITTLRATCPLIHNITNYVTVNDCANAVLAIGASPIMADDIGEAADIAAISGALVINIGTLNQRTIAAMEAAGKAANARGVCVVLDPVGAGASALRNDTVRALLSHVHFNVIRGNLSEISFLAGLSSSTKGVDVSDADNQKDAAAIAMNLAKKLGCIIGITGEIDVVSDGVRLIKIANGHKLLSKVTGTGCMTSALVASFCGATDDYFTATVAGIASMGIAGERAFAAAGCTGTGSFHVAIIDALSQMDAACFAERGKIDEA